MRRTVDEVIGEAWGGGAGWLLERLHRVTGLVDDPAEFVTDDAVVAPLHHAHPGARYGRTDLVFPSLLVAICGQKVTGHEAARAVASLTRVFSGPAPGPMEHLRLPPDPEALAEASYHRYHTLHLEKRRADVIREVSRHADRIQALADVDPDRSSGYLQTFRGIGEWTTAKTLEVSHGDPDQVAVGDFHFKHLVVHHLTGRDRGTDDEMLDLLEPFRPHRGRVIRLLHLLGHEPSFGPRLAPKNITRM